MSKKTTVIDFGSSSIKAIEVCHTRNRILLENMGITQFPEGFSNTETVDMNSRLAEFLKKFLKEKRIQAKEVKLIVSDSSLYLRQMVIPRVPESDLKNALKWQVEKYLSYPIEEALIDYEWLNGSEGAKKEKVGILLVAIQRKRVEEWLAIFERSGITPITITIAPLAVARAAQKFYPSREEAVAFVEIGAQNSSMTVVHEDRLQFLRRVNLGGDHFTYAISSHLGVPLQEAEKLKAEMVLQEGIPFRQGEPLSPELLKGPFEELVRFLNFSLISYRAHHLEDHLRRVVFSGGGSRLAGLVESLQSRLACETERVNPFRKFRSDRNPSFDDYGPYFFASLGEALG